MAWVTDPWPTGHGRWRRLGDHVRTAIPRFTAAIARREHCCSDRCFLKLRGGRSRGKARTARARTMKTKPRVVAAIVVTLLSGGALLTAPAALAADAILYPNPGEPAPIAAGWWYHYY